MEKKYNSDKLKEVTNDVRTSTLLYLMKDGKIYSSEAEKYLEWIGQYDKYCIPEKRDDWHTTVRKIVYSALAPKPGHQDDDYVKEVLESNDWAIIDDLYNFQDAAEIMETYAVTKSWELVDEVLHSQGHTGMTFSGLENVMIQYSSIGVEFTNRYDPNRVKRDKDFKKRYEKAKKYHEERTELNKRFVYAISKSK